MKRWGMGENASRALHSCPESGEGLPPIVPPNMDFSMPSASVKPYAARAAPVSPRRTSPCRQLSTVFVWTERRARCTSNKRKKSRSTR